MASREQTTKWRVIRMRNRGEYIGTIKAADEASAIKAAIKAFALDKEEAERLLLRQYK